MTDNAGTEISHLLLRAWLSLLVFLAPLKFGIVAGSSEISVYPLSFSEWLFSPWPVTLMPVLAGSALLLALLIHPEPGWRTPMALYPLSWCLLLITSFSGLIRADDYDYALIYLWHLSGTACFSLAVFRTIQRDSRLRPWIFSAIIAGTALSLISGWQQVVFGGFEQTLEFARQNTPGGLEALPPNMIGRMLEKRAFAHFVYPNSYAAHLILVGPLFLFCLWRLGDKIAPERVSRPLFMLAGLVLWCGGLWQSGSRAAFAALALSLFISMLYMPLRKHWRITGIISALLVMIVLVLVLSRGRGPVLSSTFARGIYWQCATQMLVRQPLTGVGLGNFFHEYIRLKPAGAEETRIPHSMFFNAASQSGIMAAAAALLCILCGIGVLLLAKRSGLRNDRWLGLALQTGCAAWCLHALADFNLMIPGTVMLVPVLPLLVLSRPGTVPAAAAAAETGLSSPAPHKYRRTLMLAQVVIGLLALSSVLRLPGGAAFERFYRSVYQATEPVSWTTLTEQGRQAEKLLPYSSAPPALLGRVALQTGRPQLAVDCYRTAIELNPLNAALHARLAEALESSGQLREAAAAARNALDRYPEKLEYQALNKRLQAHFL